MSRYIDAEAIIKNLKGILEDYADNGLYPTGFGIEDAIDMIEDVPTVDVQEVKHGKWIKENPLTDTLSCSICNYNIIDEELATPYCPWCGAKMDLEEEEQ